LSPDTAIRGFLDPELALQAAGRGAAFQHDPLHGEPVGYFAQRNMDGDRHRAQRRADQHHRHQIAGNPATLGDELGLAGVGESDRVELSLGDRAGDQRGRRAAAGQSPPPVPASRARHGRRQDRARQG
jgi:hypothetical protein